MSCLNTTSPHFARKGSLHAVITEQPLGHAETYFAQVLQQVPLASVLAQHEQRIRNIPPKILQDSSCSLDNPRHICRRLGQQLSLSFLP